MKKFLVLIVGIFVAIAMISVNAETDEAFEVLGKSGSFILFASQSSISKLTDDSSLVSMSSVLVELDELAPSVYMLKDAEYNCKTREFRYTNRINFSDKFEIIGKDGSSGPWNRTAPNSVGDLELSFACSSFTKKMKTFYLV